MSSERLCLLGALVIGACADFERGDPRPDTAPAVVPDAAASEGGAEAPAARSFARDVHRLVMDGCARCHSPGGSASSSDFILVDDAATDRREVLQFVNADDPGASRFLAKSAGNGHGGGAIYAAGTPEYQTILDWIREGSSP